MSDLTLMVGRWGVYDEQLDDQRQLGEVGADRVALSLLELQRYADELSLLTEGCRRAPSRHAGLSARLVGRDREAARDVSLDWPVGRPRPGRSLRPRGRAA